MSRAILSAMLVVGGSRSILATETNANLTRPLLQTTRRAPASDDEEIGHKTTKTRHTSDSGCRTRRHCSLGVDRNRLTRPRYVE